jgi:hypothetical protein
MKTVGVVAVGVISTLIGAVLGGVLTFRFTSTWLETPVLTNAEAELASGIGVLRRLHSNEFSTAELLVQSQIDGALITLDVLVRQGHTLSARTYERIDQLRRMRQEHPYESSEPVVAASARRALEIRAPTSQ